MARAMFEYSKTVFKVSWPPFKVVQFVKICCKSGIILCAARVSDPKIGITDINPSLLFVRL